MAFNPRKSMNPASSQPQQQRSKQREEDPIMLKDAEIVNCINDLCDSSPWAPMSVADLQKPTPQQSQMVFESLAEVLLNTTRPTVEPAMRAAAEDVVINGSGGGGGDDESPLASPEMADALFPADARNLMAFFASLRRLLHECGITDFGFADLYRPTPERLRRIFSYLINFARFRQSQLPVLDEHYERSLATRARIETLGADNADAEARLADMRLTRRDMEVAVAEKTRRNEALKKRLLELRRTQEKVAARLEDAKTRKTELAAELQDKTAQRLALRQDCAKLRPYVLQSPSQLQQDLADLGGSLAGDRAHIDALDRRARALQTSSDSFAVVSSDVASCIKLLDDMAAELAKEDDERARNAKQRDALTERGASVREVERHEAMLRRQLAKWGERTDLLRAQTQEKNQRAKEKTEELRAVHKQLTKERAEKGGDMEMRRVRIEQTEKKMQDMKENVEKEVHAAHDEYLKMEAHIKLYITEMEQAI